MIYNYIIGDFNLGVFENADNLSSICVIQLVHCWISMVCLVISAKILHETIFIIRLDPCVSFDCCISKLFYYSKYI